MHARKRLQKLLLERMHVVLQRLKHVRRRLKLRLVLLQQQPNVRVKRLLLVLLQPVLPLRKPVRKQPRRNVLQPVSVPFARQNSRKQLLRMLWRRRKQRQMQLRHVPIKLLVRLNRIVLQLNVRRQLTVNVQPERLLQHRLRLLMMTC